MAIAQEVAVEQLNLWPQGDARDPLGVWGARLGITGDASGGAIKVGFIVPAARKAAYVYTCYSVNFSKLTGTTNVIAVKVRLLTNWPNVDPVPGVQAFGTHLSGNATGSAEFTSPIIGLDTFVIGPNDRFLLLYDPRTIGGDMTIVEIEQNDNTLNDTYSFEAYGYFWDRAVMDTPGGPRHPGSS